MPTKKDTSSNLIIGGIVLTAIVVTGLVWWKTKQQSMTITCHTCGGK